MSDGVRERRDSIDSIDSIDSTDRERWYSSRRGRTTATDNSCPVELTIVSAPGKRTTRETRHTHHMRATTQPSRSSARGQDGTGLESNRLNANADDQGQTAKHNTSHPHERKESPRHAVGARGRGKGRGKRKDRQGQGGVALTSGGRLHVDDSRQPLLAVFLPLVRRRPQLPLRLLYHLIFARGGFPHDTSVVWLGSQKIGRGSKSRDGGADGADGADLNDVCCRGRVRRALREELHDEKKKKRDGTERKMKSKVLWIDIQTIPTIVERIRA